MKNTKNVAPKLIVSYDKKVLDFNFSALPLISHWNCERQKKLPDAVFKNYPEIFNPHSQECMEVYECYNNDFLRFTVVPFPEAGYVGFYGDASAA